VWEVDLFPSAHFLLFTFFCAYQLASIEARVNATAKANYTVVASEMSLEQAKDSGAMMLFGEKYGETVRVVRLQETPQTKPSALALASMELCGGTHVDSTIQVFPFKIVSQSAVAAGTRRIDAVAGQSAVDWLDRHVKGVHEIGKAIKTQNRDPIALSKKIQALMQKEKETCKALASIRALLFSRCAAAHKCGDVCIHVVPHLSPGDRKETTKHLQEYGALAVKADPGRLHVLLGCDQVVAFATNCDHLHAGEIMRACFKRLEDQLGAEAAGKGGGSKVFAMGTFHSQHPQDLEFLANQIAACSDPRRSDAKN